MYSGILREKKVLVMGKKLKFIFFGQNDLNINFSINIIFLNLERKNMKVFNRVPLLKKISWLIDGLRTNLLRWKKS